MCECILCISIYIQSLNNCKTMIAINVKYSLFIFKIQTFKSSGDIGSALFRTLFVIWLFRVNLSEFELWKPKAHKSPAMTTVRPSIQIVKHVSFPLLKGTNFFIKQRSFLRLYVLSRVYSWPFLSLMLVVMV